MKLIVGGKKMWRLRVRKDFSAAHHLENYEGKCKEIHGHTWGCEVFLLGSKLDKAGMVIDFGNIKTEMNKILDDLDHNDLNTIKEIGNPTAENVAKYFYEVLIDLLTDLLGVELDIKLEKVRIWESPAAYCEYPINPQYFDSV
jgi:6-pyruvoyltetrahydropterin/6-carboxytetrahydropterin synthase